MFVAAHLFSYDDATASVLGPVRSPGKSQLMPVEAGPTWGLFFIIKYCPVNWRSDEHQTAGRRALPALYTRDDPLAVSTAQSGGFIDSSNAS